MKDCGELLKFLDIAKTVYTDNFTNEANYVFFGAEGLVWISNALNQAISVDEIVLQKQFSIPEITNVGIHAKELHSTLKAVSEECTIEQKKDYIAIHDGGKAVTIKTVTYLDPPVEIKDKKYKRIPTEDIGTTESQIKRQLEFVDKTELYGSKVGFDPDFIITTDVESVHVRNHGVFSLPEFAINLKIFTLFPYFQEIALGDYFYMYSKDGTVLITKYTRDTLDVEFILDMFEDMADKADTLVEIDLPKTFGGVDLIKTFNADTRKPDRKVMVEISDGQCYIRTVTTLKGGVDLLVSEEMDPDLEFKFLVNSDKFFSALKNFDKFYIHTGVKCLWADHSENEESKFIQVEML